MAAELSSERKVEAEVAEAEEDDAPLVLLLLPGVSRLERALLTPEDSADASPVVLALAASSSSSGRDVGTAVPSSLASFCNLQRAGLL